MSIKKDGRDLWLEEAVSHSTTYLNKIMDIEEKRPLTLSEQSLKDIAAAYLFLYNAIDENKLLEGTENLFNEQTIH